MTLTSRWFNLEVWIVAGRQLITKITLK